MVAPEWIAGFVEGFSSFASKMLNYFLLSWFVLQKNPNNQNPTNKQIKTNPQKTQNTKTQINVWLHLLYRMWLLFYSVLALLLICSFMVWTYSHWNQWRSSHLIESSIVVSLIWWVLPVYYSPSAKSPSCSSTEVTRGT